MCIKSQMDSWWKRIRCLVKVWRGRHIIRDLWGARRLGHMLQGNWIVWEGEVWVWRTWNQISVLPYPAMSVTYASTITICFGSGNSSRIKPIPSPTAANHPQSSQLASFPFTHISNSLRQIFSFDWVLRKQSRLSWKIHGALFHCFRLKWAIMVY